MSLRRLGPWMQAGQDVVHPDTHELCVLLSGRVGVRLGEHDGHVEAGQASWIAAGTPHSCWTETEAVEEIVVHLHAARLDARLGSLQVGTRTTTPAEASAVRTLRHAAMHARPDLAEAPALSLLVGFAGDVAPPVTDPRLARVIAQVARDLPSAWSVAAMAKIAGMSGAQFSRSFKAAVGRPPLQWVIDQRIDRAAWLMQTTDAPLSSIAHLVGFRTPSRFTEAFVRRRGRSPSQWRAALSQR